MNDIHVGVLVVVDGNGNDVTALTNGGVVVVILLATPGHVSVPFSVT